LTDCIDNRRRSSQLECRPMTRIAIRKYSHIEASTNRWGMCVKCVQNIFY